MMEATDGRQGEHTQLCTSCQDIDWDDLVACDLNDRWWKESRNIATLSAIDDVVDDSCALCQFITAATPKPSAWSRTLEFEGKQIIARLVAVRSRQADSELENEPVRRVLRILPGAAWEDPSGLNNSGPYIFVDLAAESSKDSDTQERPFKSSIDYADMKRWIDLCENSHGADCISSVSAPPLRFIDCKSRRVVSSITGKVKYAALSYVWGTFSDDTVAPVGALPERLPLTIQDAIEVTSQLGLQYLWIDRYCMEQDDKQLKHDLIRQMGAVYTNSTITIIAACGADPDYGLPGVSARPQRRLSTIAIGNVSLTDTPPVKEVIETSKWNTRAWTFQEGIFSSRRLVFTDEQIYFQCESMSCLQAAGGSLEVPILLNETDDWKDHSRLVQHDCLRPVFNSRSVVGEMDGAEHGVAPWVIAQIQRYRSREMSFDSDALNAFAPFFELRNQTHILGLLVPSLTTDLSVTARFAYGLFNWNITGAVGRRNIFPSWTWLGWKGGTFGPIAYLSMWDGWTADRDYFLASFDTHKFIFWLRIKFEMLQADSTMDVGEDEPTEQYTLEDVFDIIMQRISGHQESLQYLHITALAFDATLSKDDNYPDNWLISTPGFNLDLDLRYDQKDLANADHSRWLVDKVTIPAEVLNSTLLGLIIAFSVDHQRRRDATRGKIRVLFVRQLKEGHYERVVATEMRVREPIKPPEDDDGPCIQIGDMKTRLETIKLG